MRIIHAIVITALALRLAYIRTQVLEPLPVLGIVTSPVIALLMTVCFEMTVCLGAPMRTGLWKQEFASHDGVFGDLLGHFIAAFTNLCPAWRSCFRSDHQGHRLDLR